MPAGATAEPSGGVEARPSGRGGRPPPCAVVRTPRAAQYYQGGPEDLAGRGLLAVRGCLQPLRLRLLTTTRASARRSARPRDAPGQPDSKYRWRRPPEKDPRYQVQTRRCVAIFDGECGGGHASVARHGFPVATLLHLGERVLLSCSCRWREHQGATCRVFCHAEEHVIRLSPGVMDLKGNALRRFYGCHVQHSVS